jgi:hypothetical protein
MSFPNREGREGREKPLSAIYEFFFVGRGEWKEGKKGWYRCNGGSRPSRPSRPSLLPVLVALAQFHTDARVKCNETRLVLHCFPNNGLSSKNGEYRSGRDGREKSPNNLRAIIYNQVKYLSRLRLRTTPRHKYRQAHRQLARLQGIC